MEHLQLFIQGNMNFRDMEIRGRNHVDLWWTVWNGGWKVICLVGGGLEVEVQSERFTMDSPNERVLEMLCLNGGFGRKSLED